MKNFIKKVRLYKLLFYFLLVVHICNLQAVCQAFFAPYNDLTAQFITMIHAEQKYIYGAMYMFTDKKVAQALVKAKERGVKIQLVLDQISMSSCGKGLFLQEQGIPVLVHRTQDFNPYNMALMHHKFFIFGCNKDNKSWLWTGSWNCTVRASQQNDENVIVLDDEVVIQSYIDYFGQLQKRLIA